MPTLNCPPREMLLGFARGDLPDDKIETVSDHLESCAGCEDTVALFEGQSDTFIGRLQTPVVKSRFADEPEFDRAVAAAKAVAREPDVAATQPAVETQDNSLGRIGDYQLLAKLGHGGMGTVYRALHTRMRRVVALKVLSTHRRHDPAVIERFGREMETAGKLSHPNIVTTHDAGEADGMHYLVMELVEGVDLHTLVSQHGPLPVADACEIIRQAARGLQHAHEHGLVHRDLKPSNLMLSPMRKSEVGMRNDSDSHTSAFVKILDLGLARLQGEQQQQQEEITATGQVMGTLDYMAPEQADDSHGVDIRSDIYALGCTLYKLLTGHAPFSGESYNSLAKKLRGHAEDPPPPIREARPAPSLTGQRIPANL
jgi:serine/threonine protein kinase